METPDAAPSTSQPRKLNWQAVLLGVAAFIGGCIIVGVLFGVLFKVAPVYRQKLALVQTLAGFGLMFSLPAYIWRISGWIEALLALIGNFFVSLFFLIVIVLILSAVSLQKRLPSTRQNAIDPARSEQENEYRQTQMREEREFSLTSDYKKVDVAELVAEPEKHVGEKISVAGFYSGSGIDSFFVYGKWASGGVISVDGSGLNSENKKQLLRSLDGFHRVLVRGTFVRPKSNGVSPQSHSAAGNAAGSPKPISPFIFGHATRHRDSVVAVEVIDLGRGDTKNRPH